MFKVRSICQVNIYHLCRICLPSITFYYAHGGGRVVSASGSETSVSSSTPTSAIIYDKYNKKKK